MGQNRYYQNLQKLAPKINPLFQLSFQQIRPLNHPLRRLVYLSKFLTDPKRNLIQKALIVMWSSFNDKISMKNRLSMILELVPEYLDPFFENHYFFEEEISKRSLGLIGKETKFEILLNSFFPFILKTFEGINSKAILPLMQLVPFKTTGKSKFLFHRFLGARKEKLLDVSGCFQQGTYQLHKDFCNFYEMSCEDAPLLKNIKKFLLSPEYLSTTI